MVEEFSYISEDGIVLRLNLGVGVDSFENNEESKVLSFFKGQDTGVKWSYNGKSVEIMEPGCKLTGYPTTDMQKVIIIYPMEHILYPAPGNAVIYNADGTFYRQLQTPELISDLAKKSRLKPFELFFDGVSWAKDSKGDTITSVRIGYNRDWWESRVLNSETGEFGEVISSGMR